MCVVGGESNDFWVKFGDILCELIAAQMLAEFHVLFFIPQAITLTLVFLPNLDVKQFSSVPLHKYAYYCYSSIPF